jgi:hypothetical protein
MEIDFILYDLPAAQGWAIFSAAIYTDPDYSVVFDGPGYIGAEVARILKSK